MTESNDNCIMRIAILMAMESEAKPYVEAMKLSKMDSPHPQLPVTFYQGDFHGGKVMVVVNGKCPRYDVDNVGTTPAALSTHLVITTFRPDLIINAGTAGGFKKHTAVIGDVFISTSLKFHDRRIPLPGFHEYGRGNYVATPCPNLIQKFSYKSGVVSTSNSLDHCDMDDVVMEENCAAVKEMEAAAIAWVAEQFRVPFFAMKVITDIVDGDRPTNEEFLENLHTAAASLQSHLPEIVEYCMNRRLADL